ncbi:MAG: replicative DNA helicase [Candidatus Paceibacterota bacterium]
MKNNPKLPPQDLEAEISVLGSLMIDKNSIIKVASVLVPEDFYHPSHQKIYEVIINLFEKGKPIDVITVSSKLKEKGVMKEVGGSDYLTELMEKVPTSAHVEHYASTVREKRVRRDLINASSQINENATSFDDFDDLLDDVEKKIFKISQQSRTQKFTHIKEGLPEAYERLEKLHQGEGEGKIRGVPTGFGKLDSILAGLQKSDFIILGARPSYGKTSLALDIARNAALKKYKVGVFSLEMSGEQIIDRMIATQSQIPLWRLRTGKIHDETEFALIQKALDELSDIPLFIEDTPSPNILHVRSMARKLQIEHGLDLLVIDYIQLIRPRNSSNSSVQEVTEISRGLKSLARELNVPVLALSQLSRAVDQREVKIPRLSDLRESGSLEQDADVVMFLYRKDRGTLDIAEEDKNIVEVIIQKHRNGPLGTARLHFDQEKVTFRNIDTHHTDEDSNIN